MNNVAFFLTDTNNKQHTVTYPVSNSMLSITDITMKEICDSIGITGLKSLHITLGVHDMVIQVMCYTLTDTIYFESYSNASSHIKILKVHDTNIHVVGHHISHIRADCSNILLADCQVDKLEIGLAKQFENIDKNPIILFPVNKLDIRNCMIKKIDIFAQCQNIDIQGSAIDEINNNLFSIPNTKSVVQSFHVWQNTNIKKITITDEIKRLKLDSSTIDTIIARANTFIEEIEIKNSVILNTYGFTNKNFKEQTLESWQIVEKSAHNDHNLKLRSEALYNILKLSSEGESAIDKFLLKIFDFCVGYGYKPIRLLRTAGLIITISAILFSIIQLFKTLSTISIPINLCTIKYGIGALINNFLLSISAFSGQSGLEQCDGIIFWIGNTEYIFGVILFAMFVNSLYLRYKE